MNTFLAAWKVVRYLFEYSLFLSYIWIYKARWE